MSVKDPSIRRWLSKSSNSSSYNEARLQHLCDKQNHQRGPATPARKRSSLARPVRIHDSFPQENEAVIVNWDESQNLQIRSRCMADKSKVKQKDKDNKKKKKKGHQLEQIVDDVVEIRVDEEITMSPIRLRLGEFFELSLPKYRKRKRRRRHRMMIATMREKTMKSMLEAGALRTGRQRTGSTFKDTERLLKVLSINNVDRDNRYNVTRCSVM
ncbi:uncharacterized protein LOC131666259 [Phymastichus coffea]|uniref:uncharacterized protein LOC131666259 n=1 Tax=Phymastichus coffea TaxID=108790 RepID=UPI00273C1BF2|nr:uncharacterized protein LOC131666259 [Phymastichus coffea]